MVDTHTVGGQCLCYAFDQSALLAVEVMPAYLKTALRVQGAACIFAIEMKLRRT